VLVVDGVLHTAKVPTTPADQSQGVMDAIEQVLSATGIAASEVHDFAHGMTVATNALLEQRGARTALLATSGFEDVLEIARQSRPDLYRLDAARPAPLVPPDLRFGVHERSVPAGVLDPLDEEQLEQTLTEVERAGVESIAICLLHSYAHPGHERRVAELVAERLPGAHVSASCELLPVFREYERTSTTVIDAYLSPLLGSYLERLAQRCHQAALVEPEIMQSSGGLMPSAEAASHAAWTVLSGPAGGIVAAAQIASVSGERRAVSFDMGGTSCDVAVIDRGQVSQAAERDVSGRVLALPMADIHTVGAGGGSVGWADAGGALRVGPRSAGADPGPACYGRGGTEPTVTDANLVLGYLGRDSELAGAVRLDADAAKAALEDLGRQLGLSGEQAAEGIVRVADHEMVRALRVVTVERGVDPRDHALLAFGGAGPMHAVRIAQELEIARVLCPRGAGVLSALGLAVSDRRRDQVQSVMLRGEALTSDGVAAAAAELARIAIEELPQATLEFSYDLRYAGQAFELPVDAGRSPSVDRLRELYDAAHEERYGYSDSDSDAALELVNVRVAAIERRSKPPLSHRVNRPAQRATRKALFDAAWIETEVIRGQPAAGDRVEGPAIIELEQATVVVPPRWNGRVDQHGTVLLEPQP
jgi:N-methylhydantoinase A